MSTASSSTSCSSSSSRLPSLQTACCKALRGRLGSGGIDGSTKVKRLTLKRRESQKKKAVMPGEHDGDGSALPGGCRCSH
jgi:hypothetical protein